MRKSLFVWLFTVSIVIADTLKQEKIILKENKLDFASNSSLTKITESNYYSVKMSSPKILEGKKFFILLESTNSMFYLTIIDDSKGLKKSRPLLDVKTHSGNILFVMSDSYFNGKLDFFKTSGMLKFKVSLAGEGNNSLNFRLKVLIADEITLDMGKIYSTRIDFFIPRLKVNLQYKSSEHPNISKLRFQVTAIRHKPDFSMKSVLSHKYSSFTMNPLFNHILGGTLTGPTLSVCSEETCVYNMDLEIKGVKTLNIESYIVKETDELSVNHFEEYYDRVYEYNTKNFYEIPWDDAMEEMDITVNLIPVSGITELFINPRTKPLELENYNWKEKGPHAKRITIRWKDLVAMKAERAPLFVAVVFSKPGEFLIRVDVHESGFQGRLHSGITESGFAEYQETINYLYFFDVFETQEIKFDVKLNIVSGDADLYLMDCRDPKVCDMDENFSLENSKMKVENNLNSKIIEQSLTCEVAPGQIVNTCRFLISVKGKENHGTHYEVSLQEEKFHRLMTPGHNIHLSLNDDQIVYLMFSYPSGSTGKHLHFSVENLWGSFDVLISRTEPYPVEGPQTIKESFESSKIGLYNSLKSIKMTPKRFGMTSPVGVYYAAIKAQTSCSMNIKFYEKHKDEITIHTLSAGSQVRGEITRKDEIVYYTIKVSLENKESRTVSVNLTPLKGDYALFASRNGKLPTMKSREWFSVNNHMEIVYSSEEAKHDEYIIGVQLNSDVDIKDSSYQFLISISYSNKSLRLNPGILSNYITNEVNNFVFEVPSSANSILILKSVIDSYDLGVCAQFVQSDEKIFNSECQFSSKGKGVAIDISGESIRSNCNFSAGGKCLVHLKVTGMENVKFSLGFTINDLPFQLMKGLVVTGPLLLNSYRKIFFVYHPEPFKETGFYFNSKGGSMNVYSKLVRGDHFDESNTMNFPSETNYNADNTKTNGHVSNVFYPTETVSDFGSSPEVLITVAGVGSRNSDSQDIDVNNYFLLHVTSGPLDLIRTHSTAVSVEAEEWNYFTFYNNGNSEMLDVFISSNVQSRLEATICKGLQARPPFTNKGFMTEIGLGSVDLRITPEILSTNQHNKEDLKGHYTLAVKSSATGLLNVYWNNNNRLNFVEITPNHPTRMFLDHQKDTYFFFYAKDTDKKSDSDRGTIVIYFKSDVKINIGVSMMKGELDLYAVESPFWQSCLGETGGIGSIEIKPTDPNYCVDCNYLAKVSNEYDGHITILSTIKHSRIPLLLQPGFSFPEALNSKESVVFQLYNENSESINLSISMLSGYVNLYISSSPEVSETQYDESYLLQNTLESHKYITIVPEKYKVSGPHDFYILATNQRSDSATFTLSVNKLETSSPIEPGITKIVEIPAGRSTDLVYVPKANENLFEVRLELRQVMEEEQIEDALSKIGSFLTLQHINHLNNRYSLKSSKKSIHENKIYLVYNITENTQGSFFIHINNPMNCALTFGVDLLNGNYKLINYGDIYLDSVMPNQELVYEAFAQEEKEVRLTVRPCFGNVEISVYESDRAKLESNDTVKLSKISSEHFETRIIDVNHPKLFFKVSGKEELAAFEISVNPRRDTPEDSYSEILETSGGKITIETEKHLVKFKPIHINSNYGKHFKHRIEYTLYLSESFRVLEYLKNCGTFRINHVFPIFKQFTFKKVVHLNDVSSFKPTEDVTIEISGLDLNTRYHGIVVAKVDIIPAEFGHITPLRSGKVYYDSFVLVSPKYHIPFNLLISTVVFLGLFFCLFTIIKGYVFGKIGQMNQFERLSTLADFDEGIFGFNILNVLERGGYSDDPQPAAQTQDLTISTDVKPSSSGQAEFEMN